MPARSPSALRGRLAILSEAYSHADFRVQVKHHFVLEVLTYAASHADEIRRIVRDADRLAATEAAGSQRLPTGWPHAASSPWFWRF